MAEVSIVCGKSKRVKSSRMSLKRILRLFLDLDYKWARGFDPALIHSVHYICNKSLQRAVSQFIDFETESNVELTAYLLQKSVVGSKGIRTATT